MMEVLANEYFLMGKGARGRTGILLVHGLAGGQREMRVLARSLNLQGYTVLAVTPAGHGGTREDLVKTGWLDWLASVRRGADLLAGRVDRLVTGGVATGAALALAQERPLHVAGVLALAPAFRHDGGNLPRCARISFLLPVLRALGIGRNRVAAGRQRRGVQHEALPWCSAAEMRKLTASVLRRMDMLRAPCLVMHARHADVASVSNAFDIAHRARNADVHLQLLADSRDGIATGRERRQVIARIATFVDGNAICSHSSRPDPRERRHAEIHIRHCLQFDSGTARRERQGDAMIVEVFQRADGWGFRGIALLGVQEDPGSYPTREDAAAAARVAYPGEAVSVVDPSMDPPSAPHSD